MNTHLIKFAPFHFIFNANVNILKVLFTACVLYSAGTFTQSCNTHCLSCRYRNLAYIFLCYHLSIKLRKRFDFLFMLYILLAFFVCLNLEN